MQLRTSNGDLLSMSNSLVEPFAIECKKSVQGSPALFPPLTCTRACWLLKRASAASLCDRCDLCPGGSHLSLELYRTMNVRSRLCSATIRRRTLDPSWTTGSLPPARMSSTTFNRGLIMINLKRAAAEECVLNPEAKRDLETRKNVPLTWYVLTTMLYYYL